MIEVTRESKFIFVSGLLLESAASQEYLEAIKLYERFDKMYWEFMSLLVRGNQFFGDKIYQLVQQDPNSKNNHGTYPIDKIQDPVLKKQAIGILMGAYNRALAVVPQAKHMVVELLKLKQQFNNVISTISPEAKHNIFIIFKRYELSHAKKIGKEMSEKRLELFIKSNSRYIACVITNFWAFTEDKKLIPIQDNSIEILDRHIINHSIFDY